MNHNHLKQYNRLQFSKIAAYYLLFIITPLTLLAHLEIVESLIPSKNLE